MLNIIWLVTIPFGVAAPRIAHFALRPFVRTLLWVDEARAMGLGSDAWLP